jgi:hypothetical protein
MLVTNHVLAGAAIGALVRRPAAALALGVASHLCMDVIPHWGLPHDDGQGDAIGNPGFLRIAYRDGLAGLVAMGAAFGLARGRRLPVLAGMVGAALLDLDKPSRHFFGHSPFPAAVDRFHWGIQVGREHEHKMGQEVAVAAGLAAVVAGLCWARTA